MNCCDWVTVNLRKKTMKKKAADGSMQLMLENLKGAELTKARVYVLAEYLK